MEKIHFQKQSHYFYKLVSDWTSRSRSSNLFENAGFLWVKQINEINPIPWILSKNLSLGSQTSFALSWITSVLYLSLSQTSLLSVHTSTKLITALKELEEGTTSANHNTCSWWPISVMQEEFSEQNVSLSSRKLKYYIVIQF